MLNHNKLTQDKKHIALLFVILQYVVNVIVDIIQPVSVLYTKHKDDKLLRRRQAVGEGLKISLNKSF